MKKFALLLCFASLMLTSNIASAEDYKFTTENPAVEYDYLTGESAGTILEASSYTKGTTDYHLVPAKSESETSINNILAIAAIAAAERNNIQDVSDPFVVKIDGKQYVMIKDNKDGVWNEKDILGFFDTPDLLFSSLVALNQNADNKITPDELKSQNVRLAAVGDDGKLLVNDTAEDFDLNKINYIDIKKLRKLANYTPDGVFGHFNVYLTDGRMIVGFVTFSDSEHLKGLF